MWERSTSPAMLLSADTVAQTTERSKATATFLWAIAVVSPIDSNWRTIRIADAHRWDGQRFIVRVDEKLTAFVELESAIRGGGFLH